MRNPQGRSTGGKRARRLLGFVAAFLTVPAIAISATFASPAVDMAGDPLKKQIAALKKQVRILQGQRNGLKEQVSSLSGRVTSLQQETALTPQLAEIAAASGRYRELANALADGYVKAESSCVPNAGFHYMRGAWPSDNVLDPLKPEFLMYAPNGGSLKLVAVEYAVPLRFPRPTFLGGSFQSYTGGPGEPIWYLHLWLWHLNSEGIFSALNRTVQC